MKIKAERLPSGNYRARVSVTDENGKRVWYSFTDTTAKKAEAKAAVFKIQEKKKAPAKLTYNSLTVGTAIDKYIELKEAVLSPSTIMGYKVIRKNNFQQIMGIEIEELTETDIQRAINEEFIKGKSPKTIKNAYGLLTASLKNNKIQLNIQIRFPEKIKKEISIPSKEDIETIMAVYKNTDMELPFSLSVYLGLRRSELCALTWEDVNFEEKTVTINKAMVITPDGTYTIKPPKTKAGNRILPLPDKAIEVLKKYRQPSGRLTEIRSATLGDRLRATQKKLEIKHFRWHDLRHYTASIMLAMNIPNKYAMEIMGHETDNMLKTVYQHTMPKERKIIADKINAYFN